MASGSLSYQDTLKLEEGDDIRPTGPTHMITSDDSSEDKNAIQILENALLTAEDDIDVQASQTVRAEAAAELAEFDETISLDELDSNPVRFTQFFKYSFKIKYVSSFRGLAPKVLYLIILHINLQQATVTEAPKSEIEEIFEQVQVHLNNK